MEVARVVKRSSVAVGSDVGAGSPVRWAGGVAGSGGAVAGSVSAVGRAAAGGAIRPMSRSEVIGEPSASWPGDNNWPAGNGELVDDHGLERVVGLRLANVTDGATIAVNGRAARGVADRVEAAVAGTGVLTALVFELNSRA